jgi:hypothetical protein
MTMKSSEAWKRNSNHQGIGRWSQGAGGSTHQNHVNTDAQKFFEKRMNREALD